jgi:hypothetical protein
MISLIMHPRFLFSTKAVTVILTVLHLSAV